MRLFRRFLFKKLTLLVFFMTSWAGMAVAQNCVVSGKVTEEKGEPIQYASVVVSRGGKDIAGTITQENGAFSLQLKTSDSLYTLQVFFVGYTSKSLTFSASKEKVQLPDIVLSQNSQTLGEVAVEAQANSKRSSVERTSLNPQAYMTEMTGSVADILRSSAAVSVNPQGQVSIRGKNLGATFHINSKNKLQADLRLNIPRLNTKQDFDNLYLTESIERPDQLIRS